MWLETEASVYTGRIIPSSAPSPEEGDSVSQAQMGWAMCETDKHRVADGVSMLG